MKPFSEGPNDIYINVMNHITFDRRKISIMTHKIWFTTSALHKSYCCNNYFYCISSYSCGGKSLHSVFIVLSKHILQQCNFNNWAQGELKDIFSRQWIELFQMRIWIEPHTHEHTQIYIYIDTYHGKSGLLYDSFCYGSFVLSL